MNLVYDLPQLSLNDIVHIWKHLSRFKKNILNVIFFVDNNINQHYLTSLIFKLDWMNKQGYNIKFDFVFRNQYESKQQYLSSIIEFDYYLIIDKDVFFTNKFPKSLIHFVNSKSSFNIDNKLIGINQIESLNRIDQDIDYLKIEDTKLANLQQPEIWIFIDEVNQQFKQSWFGQIKQNYLTGVELFYEYRS